MPIYSCWDQENSDELDAMEIEADSKRHAAEKYTEYVEGKDDSPQIAFGEGSMRVVVKSSLCDNGTVFIVSGVVVPHYSANEVVIYDKKSRPPRINAYDTGDSLIVWCHYCRRYHSHGRGNGTNDDYGHRRAHCIVPGSPYENTGYILFPSGPATEEMKRDAKRRKPRGVDFEGI